MASQQIMAHAHTLNRTIFLLSLSVVWTQQERDSIEVTFPLKSRTISAQETWNGSSQL
jgi:hypothetical protein